MEISQQEKQAMKEEIEKLLVEKQEMEKVITEEQIKQARLEEQRKAKVS